MLTRRLFLSAASAAFAQQMLTPATAEAAFEWDGTWSGTNAKGRRTAIKISVSKVVYWASNGSKQSIATSSVSARKVTIEHTDGARATLTPMKDGKVKFAWRGKGQSSTAILSR